jgi:hypothetical protein
MSLPIALTLAYLTITLALMVWLERGRANGREISWQIAGLAGATRYGPPLAGVMYLLTISGDWLFVLFVLGFFVGAAYLLNGLLAYTNHGPDGRGETRRNRR